MKLTYILIALFLLTTAYNRQLSSPLIVEGVKYCQCIEYDFSVQVRSTKNNRWTIIEAEFVNNLKDSLKVGDTVRINSKFMFKDKTIYWIKPKE